MMLKKKTLVILFSLFCSFLFVSSVNAAAKSGVEDNAQLFSSTITSQLEDEAQQLAEQSKSGVFIHTTYDNDETAEKYADNYLREKVGKNKNGILLLIDMKNRQVYVSTSGNWLYYFNDSRKKHLVDDNELPHYLSAGNYDQAASLFLTEIKSYYDEGLSSKDYLVDEKTGKVTRIKSISPAEALIAVILALAVAVAFVFITIGRYQLRLGTWTYPFRKNGKLKLTHQEDQLVNSFVTTRIIPRHDNDDFFGSGGGSGGSTVHSSGGGTFGGGGHSF